MPIDKQPATHPVNFEHYELDEPIVSMRHDPATNALYALGAFSLFRKRSGETAFQKQPILSPDNTLETCRSFLFTPGGDALCVTVYNYALNNISKMYVHSARSPTGRMETHFGGLVTNMPNQEHNICADGQGRVYMLDVPTGNVVSTEDFNSYQVDDYLTGSYKVVLQTEPHYEIQNIKVSARAGSDLHYSAFIGTTANAIVIHNGKPTPVFSIADRNILSTVNYAWDEADGRLFAYFNFPGATTTQDEACKSACRVRLDDGTIVHLSTRTPAQYPLAYPDKITNFRSHPIAAASRDQNGTETEACFYMLGKDHGKYKVLLETPSDGYPTNIPSMEIINAMYQYNGMLYIGTDKDILGFKETDLFSRDRSTPVRQ